MLDPLNDFFLVVDGMGGHACGEVAAQLAVETIGEEMRRVEGDPPLRLRASIIRANNAIHRASQFHDELTGMGCVLAALLIEDGVATVANVGDARVYRIDPQGIELLTTDHSVVGELEKYGEFSEIRLMQHPRRNEVLRCVGVEERDGGGEDFVDIVTMHFRPEYAFLLCSDGLSDLLTSSRLLELVLAHAESPRALVRALVDQANAAGGKDNVTAIVVMGNGFREAVKSTRSRSAPAFKERAVAILLSRWAVLLYGLVLGAAVMLLNCP